jgi:hypothetical protein
MRSSKKVHKMKYKGKDASLCPSAHFVSKLLNWHYI